MEDTIASPSAVAPRVLPERTNGQLKADVRKAERRDWKKEIGQCLFRARMHLGWTLDQLAAALGKDPRQVRRWESGEERTQVDVVFEVDALREPFGRELATLSGARVLLLFGKAG